MVTLNSIFEIGARALFAQQSAISATGHNIANANTPGFSRQRVRLETSAPLNFVPGQFGTGVQAVAVERVRDQFLDNQIRTQVTSNGFFASQTDIFGRLEVILSDPLNPTSDSLTSTTQSGINSALTKFFDAWQELTLNPESAAIRANLREQSLTTSEAFNVAHRELNQLASDVNARIGDAVNGINSLARQIADLNAAITREEVGENQNANDLRDRRDQLVQELSAKIKVRITEEANGSITIRAFGANLVENNVARNLITLEHDDDTGSKYFDILYDDIRSRVLNGDITEGELGGLLQQRDVVIPSFVEQIDTLAASLIQRVNAIHSASMGLEGFTTLTGTRSLSNSALAMSNASPAFPIRDGSFSIRILDSAGREVNVYQINVDPDGTPGAPPPAVSLDELVALIDQADGVGGTQISASVVNNSLQISAGAGYTFAFDGDTSGVLAALGMNEFFSGSGAGDMTVSQQVLGNLGAIAASRSGAVGDNTAALAIAQLRDSRIMSNNSVSFNDYYRSTVASLGVQSRRVQQLENTTASLVESLQSRQEQVAGTSLDEEAINLVRFQRSYTAAARLVTTVDELLDLVVNRLGLVGR